MKYTEEEIMTALQSDRETGAVMILEQYAGLLWSVCRKRLENEEDIRECVNDTFADFCMHIDRYDSQRGNLKNYLCQIADRKAIDRYHENLRCSRTEERMMQKIQTAGTSEALERSMGMHPDVMAEHLEEALEQLEPVDSQILRMKYYDGMSYQKIAAQLGLSEGTVKMRSLRSRKKLYKILIVVLILALLAACAVAVLRRYQFTEHGGFNWSEDGRMYGIVDGAYTWERDDVQYSIDDAVFLLSDEENLAGFLYVYMKMEWLGEESEENLRCFLQDAGQEMEKVNHIGESYGYGCVYWQYSAYAVEYEIKIPFSLEEKNQETIVVPLYLESQKITDLVLEPVAYQEYEIAKDSVTLLNGTRWFFGPALLGDVFTTISMFGSKGMDWIPVTRLNAGRYGTTKDLDNEITMTAEDGTVYVCQRITYDTTLEKMEEQFSQFDLYFPLLPAGEYELGIPVICYTRDWESELFTLALPEEENVRKECDRNVLFPDGSGFHITGITKTEYEHIQYHQDEGSDEFREEITYFWEYVLDYETYSAETAEFQMAYITNEDGTVATMGIPGENQVSFKIPQGEEPEEITMKFTEPEYIVRHDFTVSITVEPSAQEQEAAE